MKAKLIFSILFIVIAAFAVAFAALLEVGAALCLPLWFFAAYAMFWSLPLVPIYLRAPSRLLAATFVVFLTSLMILYVTPWNSRKPFLWDLAKVKTGMTEEEVDAIMGKYMLGTGWPEIPGASPTGGDTLSILGSPTVLEIEPSEDGEMTFTNTKIYRHSDDAMFNADWGIVQFENGRVVSTEFTPD